MDDSVVYHFATVKQRRDNRHEIDYQLSLRQQPKQSRMCGVGEKADRRPIDPPPIVQLKVTDPSSPTADRNSYLQNPYYFMYASLMAADLDEELHLLRDGKTRSTTGSVVSSLYHLKDIDNSDAGFFVFPDLSVRMEGNYRLKLSLFEIIGKDVFHCKSIISDVFVVYSAKKFPGMEESTYLSRTFADQGLKIRIRKELRQRKKTGRRNESEDEAQGYTDTEPKMWKRTRKSETSGQDNPVEDRVRSPVQFSESHTSMIPVKERQLGGPFNPIVGLNSMGSNTSPTISAVSISSTPTNQFFQPGANSDSGFNSTNPSSYGNSTEIHPLRPHVPPSRLAVQSLAPPYSSLTSKKRQTAGSTDESQWHRTNMLNSYEPTYYPDSGADCGDQEPHLRQETDVSPYRSPGNAHQSRQTANGVPQHNRNDTYTYSTPQPQSLHHHNKHQQQQQQQQQQHQEEQQRTVTQNYYHQPQYTPTPTNISLSSHMNHYSSYATNRQSASELDGEPVENSPSQAHHGHHRSLDIVPGLRRPHISRARGIHNQIPHTQVEHSSSQSPTTDTHWTEDVKAAAMARLGS
ncbi:hypothetical protein PHYBLDRAFT_181799 [Phycomyces blakesleeanus NRRL 1555(-)]|uniref:Velvet domain-containing protein n=1 Tax=Phycomyces blakesleeanus (strain ATCC 8743b / DSM 1359 / FGSC 10004 / NBRC 33097 / NRRL 1555) TaxID=763407 RepID=A0A167MB39_PHYB8|nr:hypothetical protein PHYBLDRAFT_181799 [Phycomyces blakesleeanus NRRL 1555(-)]OAD72334.1 hypothetical protein PHYBLDRAFT_181799 [Phycomyces blakesleeanus NRRL 1555(-)]|eukprot:XP_018290374.1 hypothetical protein PHYBLDRAFT_181799 [Phycomyces blakesleeanus NRRL 1555(-)]